jgi:hypothetical protein
MILSIPPEVAGKEYQDRTGCNDMQRALYETGYRDAREHYGIDLIHAIMQRSHFKVEQVMLRMASNQAVLLE